jgi:hypothetical protein
MGIKIYEHVDTRFPRVRYSFYEYKYDPDERTTLVAEVDPELVKKYKGVCTDSEALAERCYIEHRNETILRNYNKEIDELLGESNA